MKKETNVVKYRKPFTINIGVIIFAIIFIYLLFNMFIYFTREHISVYEVEQGTIAANNIYKGLVLRDETVYTSEYKGAINYYVKEYSKAGYNDLVYSVDENGSVSKKLNEVKQEVAQVNAIASEEITDLLSDFQLAYDSTEFYRVYTLKNEMNSLLNEVLSLDALAQITEYADMAEENNTFHRVRAPKAGIVSYYVDGYEDVTVDTFEYSMLDESSYKKTSLNTNTDVTVGSAAYKMINSEKWNVILPITADLRKN